MIKIKVEKATNEHDLGSSKFFGSPTIPSEWENKFMDDVIFFCQIRLSDITDLDHENKLPHKGYLYIFLDVSKYPYSPLVYYYDGQPNMVIDDFNEANEQFAFLNTDYLMEFELSDDITGTKLFGTTIAEYEEKELLLQYDPLDGMGFLEEIDGYLYFFFGDDKTDFNAVELIIDRS